MVIIWRSKALQAWCYFRLGSHSTTACWLLQHRAEMTFCKLALQQNSHSTGSCLDDKCCQAQAATRMIVCSQATAHVKAGIYTKEFNHSHLTLPHQAHWHSLQPVVYNGAVSDCQCPFRNLQPDFLSSIEVKRQVLPHLD